MKVNLPVVRWLDGLYLACIWIAGVALMVMCLVIPVGVVARYEDRKVIDQAKGILMKQRSCSEDDAYVLLRRTAMNQNCTPRVSTAPAISTGMVIASRLDLTPVDDLGSLDADDGDVHEVRGAGACRG